MQRYYTDFMLFQFHKGTIRTIAREINERRKKHFNSIKVQLEPKFYLVKNICYLVISIP